MTTIFDHENLEVRGRNLESLELNGIARVFVDLPSSAAPEPPPDAALLDVHFHNAHCLDEIDEAVRTGTPPTDIFAISGGSRVRGGMREGQVRVIAATYDAEKSPHVLQLRVRPVGDYSTYTLRVLDPAGEPGRIDPLFDHIAFKFRPGCFNLNCAPAWSKGEPRKEPTAIDYLAKDFDSFKHALIVAMGRRVPGWAPSSEADLDQVLIDLIAADADELSDFQDRVMNEAYLGLARKRVSLARHARLLDYHIHQGNQASTKLVVHVDRELELPAGFAMWSGKSWQDAVAEIFVTEETRKCHPLLNALSLYDWGGAVRALEAGSTSADLALPMPLNPHLKGDAEALCNLLQREDERHLAIEEKLNPETGTELGLDKSARQVLRLLPGKRSAEPLFDPVGDGSGNWMVRVHWGAEDRLQRRFCFITRCDRPAPVSGVSAFHGNLVTAVHGRPHATRFRQPESTLDPADRSGIEVTDAAHQERTRWGTLCRLPHSPLAYRDTPPGGEQQTKSTVSVTVNDPDQPGREERWEERIDLIDSYPEDRHFIVETDELGISQLRFGNGTNGSELPRDCTVTCRYQVGRGGRGNVGADVLTGFDGGRVAGVLSVRNPFDVVNGRDPETAGEIIRRVPLAYRSRQWRAITLEDYARRAEEVPGVSRGYARYAWTGSWRTVRVSIDPQGTDRLREDVRQDVEQHLDALRLIGEDLEVREASYVPLDIHMRLCVDSDYWPEDLAAELEREFSDDFTPDGRPGFFHPDQWTFGQAVHASQLIGRALAVKGAARVVRLGMRRLNARSTSQDNPIPLSAEMVSEPEVERIEVEPFEVIKVANDPSHLEWGRIRFEFEGGRR